MVVGPAVELDDGPDEPEPGSGAGSGPRRGRPGRRRVVAAGAIAAVLVGAGVAAARLLPPDPMPVLTLPQVDAATDLGEQPPWGPGADGRPAGPLTLTGTVLVQRPPATGSASVAPEVEARVLGLGGPGIARNEGAPTVVPVGVRPVRVPFRAVVDCDQVPQDVPAAAYVVQMDAGRGGAPRRHAVVPAGPAGAVWAHVVREGCAGWTARRDLTVTGLSARPSPTAARVELTLTFGNAGAREGTVESGDSRAFGGTVRGPTPLRVPPHGTAVGVFTVTLDGCNGVGQLTGIVTSAPLLTSAFGLVGRAGHAPPAAADGGPGLAADLVDRGIVLGEPARAALGDALDRLCGGLAASLPDGLESDSVRYDWRTRQVWVDLALNLPPGRVRSVRVQPESDPSFGAVDLVPLWSTRDLVPDAAGRLRTALPFRVAFRPVAGCTPGSSVTPPVVRLTFGVPDAGAVRQVLYRMGVDPGRDPALLAALCLPTR